MKKIIILTVILVCFIITGVVFAQDSETKMPSMKLMGAKYTLYYSKKSPELGGYINEYYKQREGYSNWTELLALHHYPNAFYPIEHAQAFKSFLTGNGILASIEVNEDDNSAILDFIIINDKKLPIILEFNVFKYVKSPVCGTVGLQYAKRYLLSNGLETEMVKRELTKDRQKYIKKVKKIQIPAIVAYDIEQGKYLSPPVKEEKRITKKECVTKEEKEFFYEDKLLNIKKKNAEQNKDVSVESQKEDVIEKFITKEEKEFFGTNKLPKTEGIIIQNDDTIEESQ